MSTKPMQARNLRKEAIEVLGFDPFDEEYRSQIVKINSFQAEWILKNLNNDNRKFSKGQYAKLRKNWLKFGWQLDGNPMTFTAAGNIQEFQHRLELIWKEDFEAEVVIVTGIMRDCFTNTAVAKPRKAIDEITRVDKSATAEQVAALNSIMKIRGYGEDKDTRVDLERFNAIKLWKIWGDTIQEAEKDIVAPFYDRTDKFTSFKRVITAYAAMMLDKDSAETAKQLLTLLGDELLKKNTTCLTSEMLKLRLDEEAGGNLTNTSRSQLVYQLLVVASDKLEESEAAWNGEVHLGLDTGNRTHESLKKKGYYRKFLRNPQQLTVTLPGMG